MGRQVKYRKSGWPNSAAVVNSSLPLATAAAVATLLAAPASAAVDANPGTAGSPIAQPGDDSPQTANPAPSPSQPGVTQTPDQQGNAPTPSQPGVTTPGPDQQQPPQAAPPTSPTQPGVTTPREAPLPVPGQEEGYLSPTPEGQGQPATPGQQEPNANNQQPGQHGQPSAPEESQQSWAPQPLPSAPAAPVVRVKGPHTDVQANIDGGTLLPGYVANTHHFTNPHGYVGTAGVGTPTGRGEVGISVEFAGPNTVNVSSFTGGNGLPDRTYKTTIDTTGPNAAKAAVENWIRAQPGGEAAYQAAAQVKVPPLIPPGTVGPQTVQVAGTTTQWGSQAQY